MSTLEKSEGSTVGRGRIKPRKILLLGSGIGKSISPAIHQRALSEVGFSARYELCDVPNRDFEAKLGEIRASEEILGFNVTIPYKEKILPFVKDVDKQAKLVGAVNTIVFDVKRNMDGFNTDVDGVAACLGRLGFTRRDSGKNAIILGAGGAARACVYAAVLYGFNRISLLNRTEGRAKSLAMDFGEKFPSVQFDFFDLSRKQLDYYLARSCDLLINSIPSSQIFPFETRLDAASPSTRYFDLNYRGVSPLMAAALNRGLETINGLLMLVEQAAKSFEIWTGIAAPRKTMMLEAEAQVSSNRNGKKSPA